MALVKCGRGGGAALGHDAIGTATTAKQAYALARKAEVASVDVNLVCGATGPEIGGKLATDGVTVVFMTGNPEVVVMSTWMTSAAGTPC